MGTVKGITFMLNYLTCPITITCHRAHIQRQGQGSTSGLHQARHQFYLLSQFLPWETGPNVVLDILLEDSVCSVCINFMIK